MQPVDVIGVGVAHGALCPQALETIAGADVLVGARWLLERFAHCPAEKREIRAPVSALADFIGNAARDRRVVVLASGDPLFFGIARGLIEHLGRGNVRVQPAVSTLSAACARLNLPWHDVFSLSVHGRKDPAPLVHALRTHDKVFVLTDPDRGPAWIGALVLESGESGISMHVLEKMGQPDERVREMTPAQAAEGRFLQPNVVLLVKGPGAAAKQFSAFGLPESWYDHERGLITKPEARAVVLSKLRLQDGHVLWDLGAGSGSVALEAGAFIRRGSLFAVEKRKERVDQILANRNRLGVFNLTAVHGKAPQCLVELPDPDRVFVGGGGPDLGSILDAVVGRLAGGGIAVVNTVLLQSLNTALTVFSAKGLAHEAVQIQVSRAKNMTRDVRFEAENPVWIVTGTKGRGQKRA